MPQQPSGERFPPTARIRTGKVFDHIFKQQIRATDKWILVYGGRNELKTSRLGMAVSKRYGNAVKRNRIKRLIREVFRRIRQQLPQGIDLIIIPKAGPEPTFAELQHSITELAGKLEKRITSTGVTAKPNNTTS